MYIDTLTWRLSSPQDASLGLTFLTLSYFYLLVHFNLFHSFM